MTANTPADYLPCGFFKMRHSIIEQQIRATIFWSSDLILNLKIILKNSGNCSKVQTHADCSLVKLTNLNDKLELSVFISFISFI